MMKGLLALRGEMIPRTHDVEELQRVCAQLGGCGEIGEPALETLSDYAVEARYDIEFWPDLVTAREAVELATKLMAQIRLISTKENPT